MYGVCQIRVAAKVCHVTSIEAFSQTSDRNSSKEGIKVEQRTVIAAFENSNKIQALTEELERSGISQQQINIHSSSTSATSTGGATQEGGFTHWVKSLFGSDEENDYHRAYGSGNTVVAIEADDSQIDDVVDILDRYDPVNMQESTASVAEGVMSSAAAVGSGAAASGLAANAINTGKEAQSIIPVIQEDLAVGKRTIQRGGVRVVSRMVETPVEETVRLRDEHAYVDRQPVNRMATAADLGAPGSQVIEVEEFAEEPVIQKTARVVEEVRVGKTMGERSETIRDTVRNTEVNVEQVGSHTTSAAGALYDAEFRRDYQQRFGNSGGSYDLYSPAYQFGATNASNMQYENKSFLESELQLRGAYEKQYPNSTWDKVRSAAQYGWDHVTKKQ